MSHKLCLLLILVVAALFSGCQACHPNYCNGEGGEDNEDEEEGWTEGRNLTGTDYELCQSGFDFDDFICPPGNGIITFPSKRPWVEETGPGSKYPWLHGEGFEAIVDTIYDLWALDPRLKPIMQRRTSRWVVRKVKDKVYPQILFGSIPDCEEFMEIFVSKYDHLTERERTKRYKLDADCRNFSE